MQSSCFPDAKLGSQPAAAGVLQFSSGASLIMRLAAVLMLLLLSFGVAAQQPRALPPDTAAPAHPPAQARPALPQSDTTATPPAPAPGAQASPALVPKADKAAKRKTTPVTPTQPAPVIMTPPPAAAAPP